MWLILGFWVLTVLFVGIAVLMGMARGLNRSVLRLVMVIVCAFVAFFIRGPVCDLILSINVDGQTLEEMLTSMLSDSLPESAASLGTTFAKLLAFPIVFVVVFELLRFLTWAICYPIGKIWVKKGPVVEPATETSKPVYNKRKGWGALVGLGQGIVLAICICMPIGALAYQADQAFVAIANIQSSSTASAQDDDYVLVSAEFGGKDDFDFGQIDDEDHDGGHDESDGDRESILPENIQKLFDNYAGSVIGKFYGKVCKSSFDSIASIRTDCGKLTLSNVIALVDKAPTLLDKTSNLMSILSDGIDFSKAENLNDLKDALQGLEDMRDELSDSEKETLNTLVSEVFVAISDSVDDIFDNPEPGTPEAVASAMLKSMADTLKDIKFTDVSLVNEVEVMQDVITDVTKIAKDKTASKEEVAEILATVSDSQLVIPIIENMNAEDLGLGDLDDATKATVESLLDDAANDDPDAQRTVDAVKRLFGIAE